MPDETGERARELERLRASHMAYLRLAALGLTRQQEAEHEQVVGPENAPVADSDRNALGNEKPLDYLSNPSTSPNGSRLPRR